MAGRSIISAMKGVARAVKARPGRVAAAALLAGLLSGPLGAQRAHASVCVPANYFVTERFNRGISEVSRDATCNVTVNNSFVTGLPGGGPDSVVFDTAGNMLISNTDVGTISEVSTSGNVVKSQVNNTAIQTVADLAMDPTDPNSVWSIGYGTNQVTRVNLTTGDTTVVSTQVGNLGGIAFSTTGRLFVSSHNGTVYELNKTTGAIVNSVGVGCFPDGMSFDPTTQHLFVSVCGGIAELQVIPTLAVLTTHSTPYTPDGIAADGQGHILAVHDFSTLSSLDLVTGISTDVTSGIPSADDVAPIVGAGCGQNCGGNPTPELGSGELFGLGLVSLLGLALYRRRRQSRKGPEGDAGEE